MSEFKINDLVMHFREGLSKITEERVMNNLNYFVLQALSSNGEYIFVPKDKANVVIRKITSKKDADQLVEYMKAVLPEYLTNTKQRRDSFKKKLGSGDIKDLAFLSAQLYYFNHPEKLDKPVKFGPADVEMLKYAHRTMFDELSITYKIKREKIELNFLSRVYEA